MSSFSSDLLNRNYEVRIGDYFSRGWEIFKTYAWGFVLFTLIFGAIGIAFGAIGSGDGDVSIGSLIFNIISPVLGAGFYIVSFQIARNRPKNFSDFFNGFKSFCPCFLPHLCQVFSLL